MKSKALIVLVLAAALVLAILYARQSRKLAVQQSQVTSLRSEVERTADQVHELELAKQHLNRERQDAERLAAAALEASRSTSAPPTGTSTAASTAGAQPAQSAPEEGFGKMIAKMMEDPDTRKFMRDQQRMVMEQLYAPLIKQLGLTQDQADKFKDLMADNNLKATEKATAMFAAGGTNRAEMVAAVAAEHKNAEEQFRELLGDAGYDQYKEYQKTAGDRMMLNMFKQQTASDAALTEQQTEQLLAIIGEERAQLSALGQNPPGVGQTPEQMDTVLSQDKTDQMLLAQESLNERVQERATNVLSPAQLQAYARFQTNQLQMMRAGMGMARKMFGAPQSPTP